MDKSRDQPVDMLTSAMKPPKTTILTQRRYAQGNGSEGDEDNEEEEKKKKRKKTVRAEEESEEEAEEDIKERRRLSAADQAEGILSSKRMLIQFGSDTRFLLFFELLIVGVAIFFIGLISLVLTYTLYPFIPTYAYGSIYSLPYLLVPWVPFFIFGAPRSTILPLIVIVLLVLACAVSVLSIITSILEVTNVNNFSTPLLVGAWAVLIMSLIQFILSLIGIVVAGYFIRLAPRQSLSAGASKTYPLTTYARL